MDFSLGRLGWSTLFKFHGYGGGGGACYPRQGLIYQLVTSIHFWIEGLGYSVNRQLETANSQL